MRIETFAFSAHVFPVCHCAIAVHVLLIVATSVLALLVSTIT